MRQDVTLLEVTLYLPFTIRPSTAVHGRSLICFVLSSSLRHAWRHHRAQRSRHVACVGALRREWVTLRPAQLSLSRHRLSLAIAGSRQPESITAHTPQARTPSDLAASQYTAAMASYTQPPPSYASSAPKGYSAIPQDEEAQPLGAGPSHEYDPNAPRREGDNDSEDFKFGVTVDQCDAEVRMQFLKKVRRVAGAIAVNPSLLLTLPFANLSSSGLFDSVPANCRHDHRRWCDDH